MLSRCIFKVHKIVRICHHLTISFSFKLELGEIVNSVGFLGVTRLGMGKIPNPQIITCTSVVDYFGLHQLFCLCVGDTYKDQILIGWVHK